MIRENDQSDLALEFSCMIIMPEPRSGDDKSATVFRKSCLRYLLAILTGCLQRLALTPVFKVSAPLLFNRILKMR